ncbi:hypothetical protein BJV82DRAFT_176012 [Fennellomyces sp. T-0311]|nr:hypothetical protein BJV82DRAFT_176012 [Fennellomyces sp. T-0311]
MFFLSFPCFDILLNYHVIGSKRMTELCHGRPIVRLPKKRDSMMTDRLSIKQHYRDVLVSDRLYTEGIPSTVSENDIMDLVQGCDPVDVHLNRADGTGYIRFSSVDKGKICSQTNHKKKELSLRSADRAYALFNNATLKNGVCLQLKISPPGNYQEPTASSVILQIKNLPSGTTEHTLYDLFRRFGSMSMCKVIINQERAFKGTALVQYFNSSDADIAAQEMNNKSIQGNTINVSPYMSKKSRPHSGEMFMLPRNPSHHSAPAKLPNGNTIDYTNLYIKNLDLQVSSCDLFWYFRGFGRIISARVMKNPQTDESKGFGFVSYSRADEARRALQEMNNRLILSKPIIVSYHEPKKPRSEKKLRSHDMVRRFSTPGIPSHPPPPYMPVAPPITEYINYSQPSPQPQGQRRPPVTTPSNTIKKRHSSMNMPTAALPLHQQTKSSPLRRRSSNESASSIATETTPDLQKKRMTEAVIRAGVKNNVEDITYMLLSLKRKERSLCLFNPGFLKEQIRLAQSALEIFRDDEDDRPSPPIPAPTQLPATIGPRVSRAIPIVAPPVTAPTATVPVANSDIDTLGKLAPDNIDKFLASIEGLPLTQQKERLGDQLFPLVKATGVKHAPRITVRLLDTVPLHELARTMHDKVGLKAKVDIAVASVQQQQQQ